MYKYNTKLQANVCLGDDAVLFLLIVKTKPEALSSSRAVALPFFLKNCQSASSCELH